MAAVSTRIALFATLVCAASAAFGQAMWQPQGQAPLPWQGAPPPQTQPMQPAPVPGGPPSQYHHSHGQGAPSFAPGSSRNEDDKKLNELATKFYDIKSTQPNAIGRLRALEHQVSGFNKELGQRSYDASDILKDSKKLQWRIASQRKKLEAKAAASAPTPVAVAPPPPPPPAGSAPPMPMPDSPASAPNAPAPPPMPPVPQAPAVPASGASVPPPMPPGAALPTPTAPAMPPAPPVLPAPPGTR